MGTKDPRHGTRAGYHAHLRAKQKPCDPCRIAKNAAERLLRNGGVEDDVPLTGGRWVYNRRRGVMVWEADCAA